MEVQQNHLQQLQVVEVVVQQQLEQPLQVVLEMV
jgi:hypothetical protein